MTNTQGENVNAILTSERQHNSDILEETVKGLKNNNAEYYNSYENDAEVNPKSDPKVATRISDGKKRKVTDTSSKNYPQKLLINQTLPIITTTCDPQIPDGVATCRGTPQARPTPNSKAVIIDATGSST